MHAILNVAIMAAREAATIVNRFSSQIERVNTRDKGANQIVSEVDIIAEEAIVQVIRQHYPEHRIVGEEGTSEGSDTNTAESEYEWLIDPLDGTQNYLHGFPHYCISIGVRYNGRLEHGVILDPVQQEQFSASRGSGAQLNNQRIRVSQTRRLSDALLSTGMPFRDPAEIRGWLRSYAAVIPRAQSVHRVGASALDMAYVAAGRYDGLWHLGLKPWDTCAGALLIQEAGGLITDIDGKQGFLDSGTVICGNPKIHEKLLQLVQPHLQ